MRQHYFLFFLILLVGPVWAQEDCACCTPNHQAFDFWVGDWLVYDTLENRLGENLIQKLTKNCIIQENWTGASGTTGSSYNYYNAQDKTWNQVWVDDQGNPLVLQGKASPGKMVMRSALKTGQSGKYFDQITWSKNPDGTVTQLWETLDTEGKLLSVLFKGIYRRRE